MPSGAHDRDVDVDFAFDEDYEHLIEDYSHLAPPSEGELLQGRVVKVTSQEVIVDFGYKLEGLVPIEQVRQADGSVALKAGDSIDVMVDRHGPPPEGYVLLSHSKASRLRIWDTLERAMREQLLVSGHIVERTKGGLMVDVGVPAFMPGSQVDVRPAHDLDQFVGQDIPVKILKLNRKRGNVVVSRKMAMEEDLKVRKERALEHLFEGAEVMGTVKNLTEYGAFVDLGGIDGLLHVSDMSHGRVNHPSEVVHEGDEITVKILKFDRAKERISLGLRQLAPDPWETLPQRCPAGSRVVGRVMSITDYGAFVEIEPGVEGLIHISEMTWSRRMKHPSRVVKAGDQVEAVVLEVKPKERRVSLGIKQLEADPWTTVADRYSIGSVVEGRVRKLTDFGAFLEIEEGVDGLVHVSDLSWTKHVKTPRRVAPQRAGNAGCDPEYRRAQPAVVAGHQAASAGRVGEFLPLARKRRHRARARVPVGRVRSVCGSCAGSGRPLPQVRDSAYAGPVAGGRCASARRGGVRFQDHQVERSREKDRPQLAGRGGGRGAYAARGLSAPGCGGHDDHRRSNEYTGKRGRPVK